jgi:hypothetical protein
VPFRCHLLTLQRRLLTPLVSALCPVGPAVSAKLAHLGQPKRLRSTRSRLARPGFAIQIGQRLVLPERVVSVLKIGSRTRILAQRLILLHPLLLKRLLALDRHASDVTLGLLRGEGLL